MVCRLSPAPKDLIRLSRTSRVCTIVLQRELFKQGARINGQPMYYACYVVNNTPEAVEVSVGSAASTANVDALLLLQPSTAPCHSDFH